MEKTDFTGFYELLVKILHGEEENIYWETIKYIPSFFRLLCNLLSDERTEWHTKLITNSALAYFVVPNDIIPEQEYKATGYIDDIFVCAYVLKCIKDEADYSELIIDNWKEDGDILEIIDNVFKSSRKIVGDKYKKILCFVGLMKTELQKDLDSNE